MQPKELLEILQVASRLKTYTRHNWTEENRKESVADHSWRVALMAMLLSSEEEFKEVDMNRVIRMCLIHDLGEAFTGDIPTFLKSEGDGTKEDEIFDKWVETFPDGNREEWQALLTEMNERKTVEAKLYKALDKLEAVISHNEADIRTWLPLEHELQYTYAVSATAFSEYLINLRKEVDTWTEEKRHGQSPYSNAFFRPAPERSEGAQPCDKEKRHGRSPYSNAFFRPAPERSEGALPCDKEKRHGQSPYSNAFFRPAPERSEGAQPCNKEKRYGRSQELYKQENRAMDLSNFQWTRMPQEYHVTENKIEVVTKPHTDLWQRTYYHFRNDNAPVFQMETEEKFFSFVVKTNFEDSHQRFDQCGIVMYLDSENWLKGSIEFENEEFQHLGSVVTNQGYSDWATTEISADVKSMWYRLSRREDDYCIECSEDGVRFQQMRVCHMHNGAGKISFGIYACSPEESSFKAVFTDMEMTECKWLAHDGQQPDEE